MCARTKELSDSVRAVLLQQPAYVVKASVLEHASHDRVHITLEVELIGIEIPKAGNDALRNAAH